MKKSIESLYSTSAAEVWKYFNEISQIPRPSKFEERVGIYLEEISLKNNWSARKDKVGNLVVSIPGKGKLSSDPILILQSHMDMVCEKNSDVNHDFMKDPIVPYTDGSWVFSEGTTLGADNGVGLALMVALAESELEHCVPLELLFTIDEETGLTGAMMLEKGFVQGRRLLNLDSEEDGTLIIGCSGGVDMNVQFNRLNQLPDYQSLWEIHIKGLRGGHSGVSIHENRLNALRIAAEFLAKVNAQFPDSHLISIVGGNKKNAIPREAKVLVSDCTKIGLESITNLFLTEIRMVEKEARIGISQVNSIPLAPLPWNFVDFLLQIPLGVLAMDPNFADLVQTSSSIGLISEKDGVPTILIHSRSSSKSALVEVEKEIEKQAMKSQGIFERGSGYAGWNPNPNSRILEQGIRVYESTFGKKPGISAIHAGLETGILGDILKINELLSVGPTIENAHAPTERVNVESVENIFLFLKRFVGENS